MRPIDADTLLEMVENLQYGGSAEYEDGFNDACEQVVLLIKGADAVERTKGTWKLACSECGAVSEERFMFCQHCGAKMDGGEQNAID